jgi:1,4-dihydroxy-2-naphthoate octaprenyltransferase
VVRLGQGRGYLLFLAVYLAAFGWIAFGLSVGFYPSVCVLAFLPLLFSLKRLLPSNGLRDRQSTINASKLTIMSHTIAGSILAVSYVV